MSPMRNSPTDKVLQNALDAAERCVERGEALPMDLWATLLSYGVDTQFYGGMGVQTEIDLFDEDDLSDLDEIELAEAMECEQEYEEMLNEEYTEAMMEEDERLADGLS